MAQRLQLNDVIAFNNPRPRQRDTNTHEVLTKCIRLTVEQPDFDKAAARNLIYKIKTLEQTMTTTMIPVFQNTLAKSDKWLTEIANLLDWNDKKKAWKALRAVLHTLRDRLIVEESTDLAAQLPMLIRGMYFEGWNPRNKPIRIKKYDEFVDAVNEGFTDIDFGDNLEPEDITRAVLKVLSSHVSAGEIKDVIGSLPEELRELWN